MQNHVSPTVVHRAAPPHVLGAALMATIQQEHHAAMVADITRRDERTATDRPGFVAEYWDAFCEAHPAWAWIVVGALIVAAMVAVRV